MTTSPTGPQQEVVYQTMQALPLEDQKAALVRIMGSLSSKDRNDIVQRAGIGPLTQVATNFIGGTVIVGAVVVLVTSTIAIIVAIFVKIADPTVLTTVFTGVVTFLGGLLTPSPVQNR